MRGLLTILIYLLAGPLFAQTGGWTVMGDPFAGRFNPDADPWINWMWYSNNVWMNAEQKLGRVNLNWNIPTNLPAAITNGADAWYMDWTILSSPDSINWTTNTTITEYHWPPQTTNLDGLAMFPDTSYYRLDLGYTVAMTHSHAWMGTYNVPCFGGPGTNIYVDGAAGNDSNSGTAFSPFKTVQMALSRAPVGGVINVSDGTYDFPTSLTTLLNTSIIGASTSGTIFQRSGDTSSLHILLGGEFRNYTLLSATPTNGSTPFWIDASLPITGLTFANLSVFGDTDCTIGAGAQPIQNWTVTNCTFTSGYDCLNWNVAPSFVYFTNSVLQPIRNPDHDHGTVRGLWIRSGVFSISDCTISASNSVAINDALHMDGGIVSITNSMLISVSTNCVPYKIRITGGTLNLSGTPVLNSEILQIGGTIHQF